jgi:hypothetical protein
MKVNDVKDLTKKQNMELYGWKKKLYGYILNDDGSVKKLIKLNKDSDYIHVGEHTYSYTDLRRVTFFRHRGLVFDKYYILFHKDGAEPLTLDLEFVSEGKVRNDNRLLNTLLRADTLKKMNDLSKPKFNLDFKMLAVILAAVVIAIYFLTGGSIGA